jgi:hypothetical protein
MTSIGKSIPILAVALLPACSGPAVTSRMQTAGSCAVLIRTPAKVRLDDGRGVYVEPNAIANSGAITWLAGEPLYTWSSGDSGFRSQAAQRLIAVRFTPGGVLALHVPPLPMPGVPTHVRLLAEKREAFAVFAVTDSTSMGTREPVVLGYWFGRTDGRRWDSLERLPPAPGPLAPARASELVRVGAELMVAVPFGAEDRRSLAIFTRSTGSWRVDTLPASQVSYAVIAARDGGAFLYAVHPAPGEFDANSLWLFERIGGDWRRIRLLVRGGRSPVHHPRVLAHGADAILTWYVIDMATGRFDARAAMQSQDGTIGPVRTVARDIEYVSASSEPGRGPWWVATHRTPGTKGVVTFVEWTSSRPVLRDVVANPFTGRPVAATIGGHRVALGPLFDSTSQEEPLISGLLRFQPRCDVPVPGEAP